MSIYIISIIKHQKNKMSNFKVFNGFGIKPSKSYSAAGWDFYVPNITDENNKKTAFEAFKKSYNKKEKELNAILSRIEKELDKRDKLERFKIHNINLLHLFLSVDGSIMQTSQNKVETFVNCYLVWNENDIPGVKLHCNDHVFINSGIKVALDHDVAGVFFNKSGRGNKGFDVRAQVVDEDYTGYVHLSKAYTKDNLTDGTVYCGDKLTQMLLLPIIHKDECEELDEDEYNSVMEGSLRGDDGFGSTDKK